MRLGLQRTCKVLQNRKESLTQKKEQFGRQCCKLHGSPTAGYRNHMNEVKQGEAVTLQAWSGPKSSRKLRFPDFLTTAQDGGKVVSPTHRPPLTPGNTPGTHFS